MRLVGRPLEAWVAHPMEIGQKTVRARGAKPLGGGRRPAGQPFWPRRQPLHDWPVDCCSCEPVGWMIFDG